LQCADVPLNVNGIDTMINKPCNTNNTFWQQRFDKLTAFQRGSLKAKSLGLQRSYLKTSRKALQGHDAVKAKECLKAWVIERNFFLQLCG
jgi:hypothetical protein